jgi:glycosyltransferase involved in cell wall biosynthesis
MGSDSGEIPYVIGEAGMVLGEQDERAWIQAISMLLEDATQRAEFARRGLDRAHSRYAWSVVARQHLEFFDSILDGERIQQYV